MNNIKGQEKPANDNPAIVLTTHFVNRSNSRILVQEYDGKMLFTLLPGQDSYLESVSMTTGWARWSEIEYQIDGKVRTVQNPAWVNPLAGKRFISIFNESGASVESLKIDDIYERFFKGILRDIYTPLNDPLVFFRRMTIRSITGKEADRIHPGYVKEVVKTIQIKEERGSREIKRIKEELEQIALKKIRATEDRRLGAIRTQPSFRVETGFGPAPVMEKKE